MPTNETNPISEVIDYATYAFATLMIVSAAPELAEDVKAILDNATGHAPAIVRMLGAELVKNWLTAAKAAQEKSRQPHFTDETPVYHDGK